MIIKIYIVLWECEKLIRGGKKIIISLKLKLVEYNEYKVGIGRKWELWERIYNKIFLGWEGVY